jgi:hypothetical protein
MRADPRHDEIRRQVEDDIADVKESQTSRHLLRGDVEHRAKIVTFVRVHSLSKANVRSNGRAHEVEDPECWQYSAVELAVACQHLMPKKWVRYSRVDLLDPVDIDRFRSNFDILMQITQLGRARLCDVLSRWSSSNCFRSHVRDTKAGMKRKEIKTRGCQKLSRFPCTR